MPLGTCNLEQKFERILSVHQIKAAELEGSVHQGLGSPLPSESSGSKPSGNPEIEEKGRQRLGPPVLVEASLTQEAKGKQVRIFLDKSQRSHSQYPGRWRLGGSPSHVIVAAAFLISLPRF